MNTNIINPLLQVVSFISVWYLYQTMSKVKQLQGHTFYFYFCPMQLQRPILVS